MELWKFRKYEKGNDGIFLEYPLPRHQPLHCHAGFFSTAKSVVFLPRQRHMPTLATMSTRPPEQGGTAWAPPQSSPEVSFPVMQLAGDPTEDANSYSISLRSYQCLTRAPAATGAAARAHRRSADGMLQRGKPHSTSKLHKSGTKT